MILISTSKGDVRLQLDEINTPDTVANFLKYVRSGFITIQFFIELLQAL